MAVTRNTYTGNGSTVLYSFTFPYLEATDIKVSVNGTTTTAYTLANATTIQFNTAPANGASIAIYRQTDDTALAAAFYPGSAIRSADLNDNFTQNLYVTQESNRDATDAIGYGQQAISTANGAVSTANAATATANTASSNASAAVATANTASSNASAAVSTANTASSNATSAVNTANAATATANSAAANAATAISTANSAVSTANSAVSTANSAVTTAGNAVTSANSAVSSATAAVSTANTASTNASNAVTTANTASSNASTALSTANSALSTANAAASAVANAILYDTVANVAAIPASPTNNDAVEVVDSTGIESFTPLSGKPAGFVGDSGLSVRIVYTTTGSTWNWIQYFPNDPENRYGDAITTLQTDLNTAEADILALDSAKLDSTTAASTYQTQAGMSSYLTTSAAGSTYAPLASPTFTGTPTGPSFSVTGSSVPTNGVYLPAANSVAISTNSTGRLFIDSSGRVGVGTGNPSYALSIKGGSATSQNLLLTWDTDQTDAYSRIRSQFAEGNTSCASEIRFHQRLAQQNGGYQTFWTTNSGGTLAEAMRIDSSQRVGIGTSPSQLLHIKGSGDAKLLINSSNNASDRGIYFATSTDSEVLGYIKQEYTTGNLDISSGTGSYGSVIAFRTAGTERARVDQNGRLLVGTSSTSAASRAVLQGNSFDSSGGCILKLARGNNSPNSGGDLGNIEFTDSGHSFAASISAKRDGGTWTSGSSQPTRLEFSTTSDNSASPSERLRIASTGALGLSGANYGSSGQVLTSQGSGSAPQWATPSSGAWQYISSVTASNSSSVAFTSGIDSTYDVYMITLVGITPVSNANIRVRTSSNGGSSYDSGASDYEYSLFLVNSGGSTAGSGQEVTNYIPICNNQILSTSSLNSTLYLYNAASTSKYKMIQFVSSNDSSSGANNFTHDIGSGQRLSTGSAVNAIQFFAGSGNISSGTFRLYGLKNS